MMELNKNIDVPQLNYLNEITSGSAELLNQIVGLFIVETPKDLEKLLLFSNAGQWELTGKQAHKLKSSVANFGLVDLKELFLKIEQAGKQMQQTKEIPVWVAQAILRVETVVRQLKIDYPDAS
jgi:HPt (histidine-containing phosphotransfer) domain-containing protein